jgi:hypothetical protein
MVGGRDNYKGYCIIIIIIILITTALQVGRSRVRFPMVSLEIFIDIIFSAYCGPGVDSASNRNEYQKYFLWGKGGRCVRLTTLLSLMC